MLIIPAIDIMNGMCVRLTQGDFTSKKVYDRDPVEVAKRFEAEGAPWLHIVDLDGAKEGKPVNQKLIMKLRNAVQIPIQVGGGIRDYRTAKNYLEAGIERIIVGTKAVTSENFIRELIEEFSEQRIAVAIDAKDQKLAIKGWQKTSEQTVGAFAEKLRQKGVKTIVVTDTMMDGTLGTPNFDLAYSLKKMGFFVIVAGGISDTSSIAQLDALKIDGAIIGKALYEGKISISEALKACQNGLTKRIIPCLDVKDGRVVKGIQFKNLADAGDLVELGKKYSDADADELVFLDIAASRENRKTTVEMVRRIAENIFIPFTVGGGITEINDMRRLLKAGADKVAINTAAVKNPALIQEGAREFGSQCIVIAIDAKKGGNGYTVYIQGGSEDSGLDAMDWAKRTQELGAGEILLTSIDRDGTQNGFDIDLLQRMASAVTIPVIASGGAGKLEDLKDALTLGKADAVLAASLFHYDAFTIKQAKNYLQSCGIPIRI